MVVSLIGQQISMLNNLFPFSTPPTFTHGSLDPSKSTLDSHTHGQLAPEQIRNLFSSVVRIRDLATNDFPSYLRGSISILQVPLPKWLPQQSRNLFLWNCASLKPANNEIFFPSAHLDVRSWMVSSEIHLTGLTQMLNVAESKSVSLALSRFETC
jgi:hypothetical protein